MEDEKAPAAHVQTRHYLKTSTDQDNTWLLRYSTTWQRLLIINITDYLNIVTIISLNFAAFKICYENDKLTSI